MHPYRRLWEQRDLETWSLALADDVVLYSPMLTRPFRGRDTALELFEALFAAFEDFAITHEFGGDGTHAFFWRAKTATHTIEGVDLIHHNSRDEISEIRVLIRPLVDVAAFGAAIGPLLVARRGKVVRVVTKVMSAFLAFFLSLADALATRLVQRG